jgi:dTDP-4-amino-4,6-dideoxygalactose transaminase
MADTLGAGEHAVNARPPGSRLVVGSGISLGSVERWAKMRESTMAQIPLFDVGIQHESLEPELRAAATRVLQSGRFILGPEGAAFEGELASALSVSYVVGVSSGTDGLLALLMAAGIGPGAEVVTTPYSFVSTVEAIVRVGATPVFADIELSSMNLDPDEARRRIGARTRAVLVVHLFGRAAQTEGLRAACAGRGVPLLEDAAQAIGASGAGRGLAQVLSFFPSKNLGGFGDGGAVLTDDSELAARLRRLRNHGAVEKMRHDVLGGNFRLDELQAALLRVKLPHLARWTEERRRLAASYRQRLEMLPIVLPPADDGCVWNQFVIRVPGDRRDELARHLNGRGIETAIYYLTLFHL